MNLQNSEYFRFLKDSKPSSHPNSIRYFLLFWQFLGQCTMCGSSRTLAPRSSSAGPSLPRVSKDTTLPPSSAASASSRSGSSCSSRRTPPSTRGVSCSQAADTELGSHSAQSPTGPRLTWKVRRECCDSYIWPHFVLICLFTSVREGKLETDSSRINIVWKLCF